MPRIFVLLTAPVVFLAQDTPPPPKLAIKAEIKVIVEAKDSIVLPAKRPEMAARANIWSGEKFWRFLFPADQPTVPPGSLAFATIVDPNDLPGGGFYLCALKKDVDKVYFNVSTDAGGSPKGDFTWAKPGDFQVAKNPDGTFAYKLSKPMKPGVYALYLGDNQYAWPFVVK